MKLYHAITFFHICLNSCFVDFIFYTFYSYVVCYSLSFSHSLCFSLCTWCYIYIFLSLSVSLSIFLSLFLSLFLSFSLSLSLFLSVRFVRTEVTLQIINIFMLALYLLPSYKICGFSNAKK